MHNSHLQDIGAEETARVINTDVEPTIDEGTGQIQRAHIIVLGNLAPVVLKAEKEVEGS